MNRKKTAKIAKAIEKAPSIHPFDDTETWLRGDFTAPPWPKEKIVEFQKRINSAFGAENALVLAWSGDRSYGDSFYTNWFANGLPKGKLERKPVLLFAEVPVSEHDYLYITVPRWLILEVHHGSELESSWEVASWVEDKSMLGGRKRIRAEKPPEFFYQHLQIIAQHDRPFLTNDMPACCRNMMAQNRICYGRYREPSEVDIAYIRGIRERMDRDGVAQRNDERRSAKLLQNAAASTRHFIHRAQQQKALAVQEMMLENPKLYLGDILKRSGNTMSAKELREIAVEAFDETNQERFA